jgi:hypothetical protein
MNLYKEINSATISDLESPSFRRRRPAHKSFSPAALLARTWSAFTGRGSDHNFKIAACFCVPNRAPVS